MEAATLNKNVNCEWWSLYYDTDYVIVDIYLHKGKKTNCFNIVPVEYMGKEKLNEIVEYLKEHLFPHYDNVLYIVFQTVGQKGQNFSWPELEPDLPMEKYK